MNKDNLTPMLKQYLEIKEEHPGFVLFYRLGDFYEMFFDDAVNISAVLGLTLTARAGTPMCGVPYHSAEPYLQKLIRKGYRVAMCEQIEINGKFNREVARLITPGTVTQDSMLDEESNNYIASFFYDDVSHKTGIAFGDLSTGVLNVFVAESEQEIIDKVARFAPSEVLFNLAFLDCRKVGEYLRNKNTVPCAAETLKDDEFVPDLDFIQSHLPSGTVIPEFPENEKSLVEGTLTALLRYIDLTQKTGTVRFTQIDGGAVGTFGDSCKESFLEIGMSARYSLELTETMRSREKKGTLLWVLDRTKTAMGKRRMRGLVKQPFANHLTIMRRLDAVQSLVSDTPNLSELRETLGGIYDIERLLSRVMYKTSNPRDFFALGMTCARVPEIKGILKSFGTNSHTALIGEINNNIDCLEEVSALIENAIMPNPPVKTQDGGYINDGFNKELDRLRSLTDGGKETLAEIERRERESTGIKTLKVGYNKVFGYYIEISKAAAAQLDELPQGYHRKQTLTNGERYITDELKQIEEDILSAKDKITALESEILGDVRDFIGNEEDKIRRTAKFIAEIDVLASLADVAVRENYCRPDITLDNVIDLKDSRHPVVEKMNSDAAFTPNDCFLDCKSSRTAIITGPNMAGKSTYMRQVALIIIMAQIGGLVPAKSARIGVTDKIFTRVGASDDLSAGQSTFMVEMLEVAEILTDATKNSFVILDEIGRGTSTYDGVSIAKAVAEYINAKVGCKTLFATHYHELIKLEKSCDGIINLSVSVKTRGDDITFLHKIIHGGTDKSYGVEVAKLSGIPTQVITQAKRALKSMELGSKIELEQELLTEESERSQIDFSLIARDSVINKIKSLDLNSLTPLDALSELSEIKKMLET